MASDYDDIRITVDCPDCGGSISTNWKSARIDMAFACPCGARVAIADDTPLAVVQRLVDGAGLPVVGDDA